MPLFAGGGFGRRAGQIPPPMVYPSAIQTSAKIESVLHFEMPCFLDIVTIVGAHINRGEARRNLQKIGSRLAARFRSDYIR